ncbi:glucose/arabinose dehydrogenase [Maribacter vaceletii]|uniref:Glucose/arabinose dehydrogenase n=1 Tax=Maribacter vaceletii TaxID=1206816 RepID=A0A495DSW1_9FLAO|nr:PQQ-dependent sugar dehydrogenase [Maribacter vaceletii]RKR07144.1 glucose/arabinose dehydrogenase [Maribacter vaceletii]
MKKSIYYFYLFVVMHNLSISQTLENKVSEPKNDVFSAVLLVDELEIPWGFTFLPNGAILITEKKGELLLFKDNKKQKIGNIPKVYKRGQGGLLDVALHPKFKENGWIYLSYASPEGEQKGGHTAILRAKLKDTILAEKKVLYKATPNTTKGQHFGSRIVFDKNNYLYFSIGERGARDINPQDIKRDGGKIYKLHDDGRIPEDNPFVGVDSAKTAIYSYGHRNPQGLILHPITGEIWNNEHGPRGGDEINIIKKGANYGWPLTTYGINYSGTSITDKTEMKGMEQPLYYWIPSIAPSGMAFITSDKYPEWNGNLLVGSLKYQYLERLILENNKVIRREKLLPDLGKVRAVKQGPDGYIYVAVEGKGIYKLIPNSK